MPRNNLISATLDAEQRAEVFKCLNDAQSTLNFLVTLSKQEKKPLIRMGPASVGYVDECIRAFEEFRTVLPGDIDVAELKRDRALYEGLIAVTVKVRALYESLADSLVALGSDMMLVSNDGYNALKRGAKRNNAVKTTVERIGMRYKKNGKRKAKVENV